MASSQPRHASANGKHQINAKALSNVFKANKFVLIAYTGLSTRINTTRWYVCESAIWSRLRHNIEAFGLDDCESEALGRSRLPLNGRPTPNTIIRGFTAYRVMRDYKGPEQWPQALNDLLDPKTVARMPLPEAELKGSDWALPNTFVFVVRCALPWGARPYVPLEERSKYLLLHEKAQYDTEDPALKAQIQALREQVQDQWHAADRPIATATLETQGPTYKVLGPNTGDPDITMPGLKTTECHSYSVPPLDYLCPNCREFGRHYADACWLFTAERAAQTQAPAKGGLQFGAKKFGGAKTATTEDATFYALLHKRAAGRPIKS